MATARDKEKKREQRENGEQGRGESTRRGQHLSTSGGAPMPYRRPFPGALGRWEPLMQMRQEFDRFFDQFFRGWAAPWERGESQRQWGLDVHEDDNNLMVRAEAPGFEPDEIDVEVRGDQLVICACHKEEEQQEEGDFHQWKRQEFFQSIPLPSGIDAEHIEAKYRNGVLTLKLPKTEESKGRRISVTT